MTAKVINIYLQELLILHKMQADPPIWSNFLSET